MRKTKTPAGAPSKGVKNESLRRSTSMLYLLTLASYIFSFVTVPYQTRVLGPDYFGRLSVALATGALFAVVMEYGFMLSGTSEVSRAAGDRVLVGKIVSSITGAKLALLLVASLVLLALTLTIPTVRDEWVLFWAAFGSSAAGAFLPDYAYRGMERMTPITVRAVLVQSVSVVLILTLVRRPQDYFWVPVSTLIPNVTAVVFVYLDLVKRFKIKLRRPRFEEVFGEIKRSWWFFASRAASRASGSINVVALGATYPAGSAEIGLYAGVERLGGAAMRLSGPLADSLFPYMERTRNYGLLRRVIAVTALVSCVGCGVVAVFADGVAGLVLGTEYAASGSLLRILLIVVAMTPVSYLLGFPFLSPLGMGRWANFSAIAGSVVQITSVLVLMATGRLTAMTALYAMLGGQILVLFIRLVAGRRALLGRGH